MIHGLGTDIIEIDRIRSVIQRHGEHFLNKTFTPFERHYCEKYKDPVPRYAVRFSAKEALVKALGTGFTSQLTFLDIEIKNNHEGKPSIELSSHAEKLIINKVIHLSMSHCKNYATAVVIITE